jgi:hypothetical protein
MSKFTIQETISFEVEADTAQEALDAWLQQGDKAPGYSFISVDEREVTDEDGRWCPVDG